MEFIDNTGHIFTLQSYTDEPIVQKYKENDYIFWLKDNNVSINNYYIKPIRFIIDVNSIFNNNVDNFKLLIKLNSSIYKLIGPKIVQEELEKNKHIADRIFIDFNNDTQCKQELTESDFYFSINSNESDNNLIVDSVNSQYILFPFYIIGKSSEEGTYLTNIMIQTTTIDVDESIAYEYTPITIGCTFIDECEELVINGKNMGIRLPKEILRAIYDIPFDSIYSDEKKMRTKLKELLLNYMSIKGECGNFKSVYNSLKWFEWGKHVEISKLIKTDNEFQTQYILDYFEIENDLKSTYDAFNSTNIISLSVKENIETNQLDKQLFDELFIGEGKPIMEDLFYKNKEVEIDDLIFYEPYYKFIFTELALKLDCLKYYYKQYFLPVHININRASITRKVYANDTKMTIFPYTKLTEAPIYIPDSDVLVEFPLTHEALFCKTKHYVDQDFHEFSIYNEDSEENLYWVNENCVTIPIKIINKSEPYTQSTNGKYIKFNELYYKLCNLYKEENGKYVLCDINEATHFKLSKYDQNIYELNQFNQYDKISSGYFSCFMTFSVINKKQSDYGKYVYIDDMYLYKDKFYDKDNNESEYGEYIQYDNIRLNNNLDKIKIDKKNRYDITFKILKSSYFNFYQDLNCYYQNFIILPRYYINQLLNENLNIDWLNSEFRISILVNNKWFNYDFRIKTPNIYLELGKLKYRYYLDEETKTSMFKQLMFNDYDLKFNSFMYQPDLVSVDTIFYDKDTNRVLSFIEKLIENRTDEGDIDESKMYEFYYKYYKNSITVPYNPYYFNQLHIFEIYSEQINQYTDAEENLHEELIGKNFFIYNDKYDLSKNPQAIEMLKQLYSEFYDRNGNFKVIFNEPVDYDAYLMHDPIVEGKTAYWYIVLISKAPISKYLSNKDYLKIHTRKYQTANFTLEYNGRSIEKFLVNRMDIVPTNGINHFAKNNIAIVDVYNNDYQFNIDLINKYEIAKAYDPYNVTTIETKENISIITNNNYDGYYDPGYYNIHLNYTINGLNNYGGDIKLIYRVDNEIENIKYVVYPNTTDNALDLIYTISTMSILYEKNGQQFETVDILDSSLGWTPIALKIINENYFGPNTPARFIGLKFMVIDDENGTVEPITNKTEAQALINRSPWFGFTNINITDVPYYNYSHYLDMDIDKSFNDRSKNEGSSTKYIQSDTFTNPPILNGRGYSVKSQTNHLNFLDNNDNFNKLFLDDKVALYHVDGKSSTQMLLDASTINLNDINDLKDKIGNSGTNGNGNVTWSPAAMSCYIYHTNTTNIGDWYLPSAAELLFISFNYNKLNNIVHKLAKIYPNDVNSSLFDINNILDRGYWSSTLYNAKVKTYDIHPRTGKFHAVGRSNRWYILPFLQK